MSYSKKILLLYRSCDSRVEAINEEIRTICVRSFGFKKSVERIFDEVYLKAKEKEDLLWLAKRVKVVLERLGKDNREILMYRYLNVLLKGGEEKRFSKSGYYRRLTIAEALFEEYLSYVGLSEVNFDKEYGKYPWAKKFSENKRRRLSTLAESIGRVDETENNPFLFKRRGRPRKVRINIPVKPAAKESVSNEQKLSVGGLSEAGAACASAAKKPIVIRVFPTRLA